MRKRVRLASFGEMKTPYFRKESNGLVHVTLNFESLRSRLLVAVVRCVQNGDFTERSLARVVAISQPHLHHILKGARTLKPELADKLMRCLGMSVVDLMSREELIARVDSRELGAAAWWDEWSQHTALAMKLPARKPVGSETQRSAMPITRYKTG